MRVPFCMMERLDTGRQDLRASDHSARSVADGACSRRRHGRPGLEIRRREFVAVFQRGTHRQAARDSLLAVRQSMGHSARRLEAPRGQRGKQESPSSTTSPRTLERKPIWPTATRPSGTNSRRSMISGTRSRPSRSFRWKTPNPNAAAKKAARKKAAAKKKADLR